MQLISAIRNCYANKLVYRTKNIKKNYFSIIVQTLYSIDWSEMQAFSPVERSKLNMNRNIWPLGHITSCVSISTNIVFSHECCATTTTAKSRSQHTFPHGIITNAPKCISYIQDEGQPTQGRKQTQAKPTQPWSDQRKNLVHIFWLESVCGGVWRRVAVLAYLWYFNNISAEQKIGIKSTHKTTKSGNRHCSGCTPVTGL